MPHGFVVYIHNIEATCPSEMLVLGDIIRMLQQTLDINILYVGPLGHYQYLDVILCWAMLFGR